MVACGVQMGYPHYVHNLTNYPGSNSYPDAVIPLRWFTSKDHSLNVLALLHEICIIHPVVQAEYKKVRKAQTITAQPIPSVQPCGGGRWLVSLPSYGNNY